jgi:tetratricopeptide (TPR) repeat protein
MCASFDEALKHMGRIPEILFDYAQFLQENNQYPTAERLYRETLAIYRERTLADATLYLPELSVTLNNLAYLIQTTLTRRREVEMLYQEALANYRKLVVLHPTVYQPHLANVLWGFAEANMYWQELKQAILLLDEAAMLITPFAKAYPAIFSIRQDAMQRALEQTKSALDINGV